MTAWNDFVKAFARKHNITYGCALTDPRCSVEYQKSQGRKDTEATRRKKTKIEKDIVKKTAYETKLVRPEYLEEAEPQVKPKLKIVKDYKYEPLEEAEPVFATKSFKVSPPKPVVEKKRIPKKPLQKLQTDHRLLEIRSEARTLLYKMLDIQERLLKAWDDVDEMSLKDSGLKTTKQKEAVIKVLKDGIDIVPSRALTDKYSTFLEDYFPVEQDRDLPRISTKPVGIKSFNPPTAKNIQKYITESDKVVKDLSEKFYRLLG